ncbi:hypothetical protein JXA85_03110, partial [Candidatus Woesearchaeota archaeon]|nr:hypothetical protein [Candidatus Woesearchaeota archaeon]
RFEKKNGLLVAFVVFIVSVDLLLVSIPIYKNTFAKSFEQPATKSDFTQVAATNMYTMQYQNLLQNRGTVNCYERMHPDIRAYPKFRDDGAEFIGYVGEAYVAETNQTLGYSQFSPNVVAVRTQGTTGTLVVNQNYYPGWRSSGKEVRSHNGLLSVHVDKNDSVVEFYYLPSSFIIGLIITAISFTGTLCIFLRKPHPK